MEKDKLAAASGSTTPTLELKLKDHSKFQILSWDLGDKPLEPQDLRGVDLPESVQFHKGVIFSGRGPIWLYAHLVHLAHPAAWVGVFDPRLGGAVVVQRHTPSAPRLGEVIPLT